MTALEELRHSTAHILATAVLQLFPNAKLDIGPPTATGFYYDFDLDHRFTAEDLKRIEVQMKEVIKEKQDFERIEMTRPEAEKLIREIGQERYKLGRLQDIPEGDTISFYQNGDFIDLCAGTHVSDIRKVRAFKLLNVAGTYHRGDEKNPQLQRIYGTVFANKEELNAHLHRMDEARRRDHRVIGRDLGLFHLDDLVGSGLVLWTPNGAIVRQELQDFISAELRRQGYQQVFTPHIGKLQLYRTSGHFPYFSDSQYPPLVGREEIDRLAEDGCSCAELSSRLEKGEVEGYLLKPMNCPMHIRIYSSKPRSYRDLPVRLAEFGTVYRWEKSGELNGMARVRGLTMDDAHIFCTENQVKDELAGCLGLVNTVLGTFGIDDYQVRISLRDPNSNKYTGDPAVWERAEKILREQASTLGVPYLEEIGEAAFYGPKIDFVITDVIGREWQLGTVQLDYNLPERFELTYIGPDNLPHRPVMIHRAPFGSMERFVSVLIEHFAGNFPTWLAPKQVRVLPITDLQNSYAEKVTERLKVSGIRAQLDGQPDRLNAKIRRAETEKVSYMLVIGAREMEAQQVSVRSRTNRENNGTFTIDEFLALLTTEIEERRLPQFH